MNRRNGKKFLDCANQASLRFDGSSARRNGYRNSTAWRNVYGQSDRAALYCARRRMNPLTVCLR